MTINLRWARFVICVTVMALAVPAFAQSKKGAKKDDEKAAAAAPPPAKKVDLPAPPANFDYAAQGRRDPFVSLANRGADGKGAVDPNIKRGEGVAGITTGELTVRGILQTRGTWVAMVSGPDGKVFTIRAGDKLADGVIREVSATTVVILQEVNDPLSLEKQREVRKSLRGGE
jgi:Tfp pilus assembly protein PilP